MQNLSSEQAAAPAPSSSPEPASVPQADAAKNRAALSSVLWSGFLTLLKIVAALSSNSLGMLSEALHSAMDLVAASITFFAVRVAARPADTHHPFGHGKVENLSALAETLLLFFTCAWIVWEAVERLFFNAAAVEPSWWVFGVVIVSLTVDISRSAMLRRVAREHRSQALEADALHFTTDVWSSAVVLAGLACVAAARHVDPASPLHFLLIRADAVAALGVAGIVLVVSWKLACRAVNSLMDGGGQKEASFVRAALAEMAPAYEVRRIRVRESGSAWFVDLTVAIPPALRVDDAHELTEIFEDIVASVLPGAQTVVHLEPESVEDQRDLLATAQHLAAIHGLPVHGLALVTLEDGLHVFGHVELPRDMALTSAHAKVSAYENDLLRRLGAVHVVTHIEPMQEQNDALHGPERPDDRKIVREALDAAMEAQSDLWGCHDVEVWTAGHHEALSFRCRTRSDRTVCQAHKLASRLEADLRRRVPRLGRVTIHVEPDETDGAAPGGSEPGIGTAGADKGTRTGENRA